MGGNQIACKILRHLFRLKDVSILLAVSNWNDNGSVIEPHVWNASLTRVAISKNLQVIQPFNIHSPEFLKDIKRAGRPDLIITADYEHYLPKAIIELPRLGVLNVHFSKLPRHRGAFPVIWSMLEDEEAGVTIHWVNEKIHAGDIIAQKTTPIKEDDTSFSLYSRLTQMGIKLFIDVFPKIMDESAPSMRQNEDEASFHSIGYPNQSIINWTEPAEKIRRFIYALYYPTVRPATAFINSSNYPIFLIPPVRVIDNYSHNHAEPGRIISINEDGIAVQTGDGILLFERFCYNSFSAPVEKAVRLGSLFDLKVGSRFMILNPLRQDAKLNLIHSDYSKFIIAKDFEIASQAY